MPRPLRVEYPGALYHVVSRGNRREAIFIEDTDRELFLATFAQACQRTGWQV
jgi:putative transposase